MKALSKNGLVLALAAILFGPAAVGADHLPAVQVLDADQLKVWIDQGNKMLLVDSRVASEYNEGHIPTAISIPAPVMDQYRAKLPSDDNYPLVFYCNGWPECKKSHDASSQAVEWGYRQVYWFRDGIPVWEAKGYPLEGQSRDVAGGAVKGAKRPDCCP
jgi:rhodanese-related sulfurtransferase